MHERAAQLREAEHEQEQRRLAAAEKRQAAKRAQGRKERMKRMAAESPKQWLREADRLVAARGTANYEAAAELLDELREALAGDDGASITRKHAARLAKKHPTLNRMKSALRRRGLLK